MSAAPLISVRIPSYNHGKYIEACISSILRQTFQDFEIVIVDDCSTDDSVSLIRNIKDPRIKLEVLKRNSGMNVAVARCMQLCQGKYVANISSDDMWEPTKLEKQVEFLERNKEYDAVFTQVKFIDETGRPIRRVNNPYAYIFDYKNRESTQWLRRFFYLGNCLCNPSVLIDREVYKSLGYQDKRLVSLSDFDLWVKFALYHKFWILNEDLTKFRLRKSNANLSADTSKNKNRMSFEHKQILDNYLSITDTKMLTAIFPESLRYGEPEVGTIPYFLGRLAIDTDSRIHQLWGCEKIYNLMRSQKAVESLEKHCNFRYVDFYALTQRIDLLNTSRRSAFNKVLTRFGKEAIYRFRK